MLDVSRSTIERMVKAGEFPAPVKVRGSVRFLRPDVDRWFEDERNRR